MNQLQVLIASFNGFDALIDVALRGAVILALAVLITSALRRASAAARHLVWAVAVTAVLLLPLISLVTPAWRVLPTSDVMQRRELAEAVVPAVLTNFSTSATVIESDRSVEQSTNDVATVSSHQPRVDLPRDQVAFLIWLAGALLMLGAIALGFLRVAVLTRSAQHITDAATLAAIAEVSSQLKVGRVLALEAGGSAMPMTWGLMQPKLLLPAAAKQWSRARLYAVLRHELAHVRRRDSFWQLMAEVTCALHWFNPFAWYAARQMRIEREHACDDEVLMAGSRASEYATELLEIARSLRSARATSLAAIAMAQPSQLEGRLLAVLDQNRARKSMKRRWPAWLAAVVIVGPVAGASPKLPTQPRHSEKAPSKSSQKPVTRNQPAVRVAFGSVVVPSSAVSQQFAALQQAQTPCGEGNKNLSINTHGDDDRQEVKWEAGGCKGRITMSGKVRLAGDLSGIESLSRAGEFRLWLNDGRDIRVVNAKPGGSSIVYEYTVNGDARPWNTEGRAWFASILAFVVRSTGFAADERVEYLLRTQGPSGVLAEVEKMSSDYVQRLYLHKLVNKAQLNGTAVESVLATAKRSLESDYEMTELLIAVANKYAFTEGVRRAFIEATGTLESDYEHRRALSAVLKKGGLSSENVAAMLTSSQRLASDYEKAELLLSIAGRYSLDPGMRSAYLASARKMESDYEKGRVFKALLKQAEASSQDAALILESVATMESDYERAELLRMLPPSGLSNAEAQTAYLNVIADMRSDYEMRRSLSALMRAGRLSAGALNMVLNASSRMRSDYERAELLLSVLNAYRLNESQRQSVVLAANGMKSEYERGRVSSALLRQLAAPPPSARPSN